MLLSPHVPVQPAHIFQGLGHLRFPTASLPLQHHRKPLQDCREAPLSSQPLSLQGNFRHFGLAVTIQEMRDELHSILILNANKVKQHLISKKIRVSISHMPQAWGLDFGFSCSFLKSIVYLNQKSSFQISFSKEE